MGKISDALRKINKERQEQKKLQERRLAEEVLRQEQERREKAKKLSTITEDIPQKEPSYETISQAPHDSRKEDLAQTPIMPIDKNILTKFLPKFSKGQLSDYIQRLKIESFFVAKSRDSSGIDPRIVTYHDYSSPVAEQYRILRTNIKSRLRKKDAFTKADSFKPSHSARVFCLSSSLHSEGKTISSINLAVALAKDLEAKVLLMDCDLRNGLVHKFLNLNARPGLSDILVTGADYRLAVHKTKLDNLFVIPRGGIPSNPSELLGSKDMRMLLAKLKEELFSYIIIDTPPVMLFTDAGVLSAQTEGVILVVQAYRTKAAIVQKTKDSLKHARSKLLGFVLTQADYYVPDMYGYYHYYRNRNNAGNNGSKQHLTPQEQAQSPQLNA
ncbi:MAG: polysaccharide biosynthesis tyrosine autokinase [Candidatus Omnitrophica bacterium]|nr:polysaccharide biosynthesis tyrosine autokinase [Candidatus Omnitrophota bacterium]